MVLEAKTASGLFRQLHWPMQQFFACVRILAEEETMDTEMGVNLIRLVTGSMAPQVAGAEVLLDLQFQQQPVGS